MAGARSGPIALVLATLAQAWGRSVPKEWK